MPRRIPCALLVFSLVSLTPAEAQEIAVRLPGEMPLPGTGLSLYHVAGKYAPRPAAESAHVAFFARVAPSGGLTAHTLALDLEARLGLPLRSGDGLTLRAALLFGPTPLANLEACLRAPRLRERWTAYRQRRHEEPLRCRLRGRYFGLTR